MMQKHLTAEDMIKYLDTSDLSEEYLLWMEKVSNHLAVCTKCQEALQRALEADFVCEEEGLQDALKSASREEEIRKSILICKLQKQESLSEVIRLLREQNTVPHVLQMADLQGKAEAVRGEKNPAVSKGAEFCCENGRLLVNVYDKGDNQKMTVVLERKDADPIVRTATWDEGKGQWTASFEIGNQDAEVEVYIL